MQFSLAFALLLLIDIANCGYHDKDLMEDHLILIKPVQSKKVVQKRAATTKRDDKCGPRSR
jgi:hypothetical protein